MGFFRNKKVVQPNSGVAQTTDYLYGFQYLNGQLQFFPHAEGYVKNNAGNYVYHYIYKDHLGNVRLSYADCDGNGTINPATEILEENNYYPFGLQHQGYNDIANSCRSEEAEAYKYNGKEYEDTFGLNIYEMDMRQLDPAIGRWMVMDPVVHHDYSPYSAFDNNPVYWSDPSGADSQKNITIADLFNKAGSGITTFSFENGQLVGESFAENIKATLEKSYLFLDAPTDDNGGGGGDGKGSKNSFQPPTAIMSLAREIGMQYGYSIAEQDLIIDWLKKHTVIEKNGIVTLKGIDGLSININNSDLLIEKSLEAGAAFASKFALKKLISYGTTKLIGGAFNMTLNTQSLNNYPNQQQKALEQMQKALLINSAGDRLIHYIFQRPVNIQEPSMLNKMTKTVTPTGFSLWQTKYN